jgi:16S rRNA (cytidine1402-2'-O)-methyltransferase
MIKNNPYDKNVKALVGLVTTPIGNRDDITLRALKFLKEADIVACEDTRNTGLLLSGYDIKPKRLVSLYAQTELKEAKKLVEEVKKNNLKLAYCSDAGMPGISDPGALLVQACYEEGVAVTILPGPTASLSALVISGIDSADFTFYGFLPTKAGQIKGMLEELKTRKESLIFYESPKRLVKTIGYMATVFGGERKVSIIRELTKIHEEVVHGTLEELIAAPLEERGECVIIVEGFKGSEEVDTDSLEKELKLGLKEGKPLASLSKELALKYKVSKKEVYNLGLELK